MSEFHIEVVRIGKVEKVSNSDSLSLTKVHGGYPCIFRTGDFNENDLAVYVVIDSMVPIADPRFSFLAAKSKDGKYARIRAIRLRGTFSMGLLVKPDVDWKEGQDVCEALGITKYEPPLESSTYGDNEKDHGQAIVYDIEGFRRYPDSFVDGEEVWVSEKIHGCNARFMYYEDRLWCGSRNGWKKDAIKSIWWQTARNYDLANKLRPYPNYCFYGECYGQVADLKYDVPRQEGNRLICFDALDIRTRTFLDVDDFLALMKEIDLPVVPTLYRGGFNAGLLEMAEGKSTIADNVREGIVIKPIKERVDIRFGRMFLKLHGQGFLLRKEK